MGTRGYRIAIGAGSSPHNLRGSAVLKDNMKAHRQAWKETGYPGEPTTVVASPPWWLPPPPRPRTKRRP